MCQVLLKLINKSFRYGFGDSLEEKLLTKPKERYVLSLGRRGNDILVRQFFPSQSIINEGEKFRGNYVQYFST